MDRVSDAAYGWSVADDRGPSQQRHRRSDRGGNSRSGGPTTRGYQSANARRDRLDERTELPDRDDLRDGGSRRPIGPQLNLTIGYYRLYWEPSADMESFHPLNDDDPSLSQFYHEHVPPPRKAENYIAYICQRENIHPSRVNLYVNVSRDPEEEDLRLVNRDETMRREPCGAKETNPFLVTVQMEAGMLGERGRELAKNPVASSMGGTLQSIVKAMGSFLSRPKTRDAPRDRRRESGMERAREPGMNRALEPALDGHLR